MCGQQVPAIISFGAQITLIWFYISMSSFMISLIAKSGKSLIALRAFKGPVTIVNAEVHLEIAFFCKYFTAF